jgi:hypothetical protein
MKEPKRQLLPAFRIRSGDVSSRRRIMFLVRNVLLGLALGMGGTGVLLSTSVAAYADDFRFSTPTNFPSFYAAETCRLRIYPRGPGQTATFCRQVDGPNGFGWYICY